MFGLTPYDVRDSDLKFNLFLRTVLRFPTTVTVSSTVLVFLQDSHLKGREGKDQP